MAKFKCVFPSLVAPIIIVLVKKGEISTNPSCFELNGLKIHQQIVFDLAVIAYKSMVRAN